MDAMARGGVYLKNAFVTTSLCSPSRASIFTGKYAHQHRIVDNNTAIPAGTVFYPSYLQKAGYKTAFFGKWHMGNTDDQPQPGFDRWVSFKGQGSYLPEKNGLNVDGRHVPQKGYITDELTDYTLDWIKQQPKDQPYFVHLAHKAVHSEFIPPDRYKGRYDKAEFHYPKTMAASGEYAQHRPMWTQNQRNSWHGVEFPYHSDLNIADYYKRYAETLLGVDDSLGRLMQLLEERGELNSTLILYMGDNGFAFGEHGLIDKRTAYEESMRVPLLAHCPELTQGGNKVVEEVVANIDIMPTVLQAASTTGPSGLPGRSFLPLLRGEKVPWRDSLLYEYYWERNFPQTPTVHALRGARYKYVHLYGHWDIDELYDLEADPMETTNLIFSREHQAVIHQMNQQLFATLEQTGGMYIPLFPDRGQQNDLRNPNGSKAAQFPPELVHFPATKPVQS
jgi:N-acetylglucosamine-6-sulfatase